MIIDFIKNNIKILNYIFDFFTKYDIILVRNFLNYVEVRFCSIYINIQNFVFEILRGLS